MNLFLLLAVPLAVPVLYLQFFRQVPLRSLLRNTLYSLVWSLVLLIAAMLLTPLAVFRGDLFQVSLGLVLVQGLISAGLPVLIHLWAPSRPANTGGEPLLTALVLGQTLALLFGFIGLGDFLTTSHQSDLWDLFLVPIVRVALILGLVGTVRAWLELRGRPWAWILLVLAGSLCLVQPGLALLWFTGAKVVVAILAPALLVAAWFLLGQKKAAPNGGGPTKTVDAAPVTSAIRQELP